MNSDPVGTDRQRSRRWRPWLIGVLSAVAGLGLLAAVIWLPPLLVDTSGISLELDRLRTINDFRGTLVTVLGGIALAAGTVVAGLGFGETRHQNRATLQLTQRGQLLDLFSKSIDQLGQDGSAKLDVRLGAIYALEQIARDSLDELHQPVMEILTAFLRGHADEAGQEPPGQLEIVPAGASGGEVLDEIARFDVVRTRPDFQAAASVLGRRFRRDNEPTLDMRGVDLGGADLQHAHLERVDLRGANLNRADLRRTHLEAAILREAHLEAANLLGAYLKDAVLADAHAAGAHFADADLEGRYLARMDLRGAHFGSAKLKAADLLGACLNGAFMADADLEDANLRDAHFEGANLTGAHLERTDLSRTHLVEADLRNARLDGARFVDLTALEWKVAEHRVMSGDLSATSLPQLTGGPSSVESKDVPTIHLEDEDWTGVRTAHLEGAMLAKIHLEGADLRGVHLNGANLQGAFLDRANLVDAHLEKADLYGAHLAGADLRNAHLDGADLRQAIVHGANFEGALGLTADQLIGAVGTEGAKLPPGIGVR